MAAESVSSRPGLAGNQETSAELLTDRTNLGRLPVLWIAETGTRVSGSKGGVSVARGPRGLRLLAWAPSRFPS